MSNYLYHRFHDSPEFVNVFDEQPLWSAHFGQFMLKHIPLKANITVLELGSGTGFPLLELAERLGGSCRLYGLDPWQNANARAREKIRQYGIENTEILDGTGAEIPFGDNSIDLITSSLGINNFEDREKVFAECARVLKPGGILALTTNLQGHWQEFYEVYDDVLRDNGRTEELQELKAHIARRGSVDSISALFTGAGLRVSRTFTENFSMRFLDGSAFLRHHFIGVGWMEEWVRMLPEESRTNIFLQVEERLNQKARQAGELKLNVPMAYIEGVK